MAYVTPNFKTKKALKEALAAGTIVRVFSPSPFGVPSTGKVAVEGPHYPAPHSWYAEVRVEGGIVREVK